MSPSFKQLPWSPKCGAVQSDKQSTDKEKASASTNLAGAITLTGGASIATAAYVIYALYRWWQHQKNTLKSWSKSLHISYQLAEPER
ncbi:hypothetical protein PROFUN_16373 [Planoprotostelium fungivorum]|uniref:Uncharacterized protein n=1 Tax=Planoprotostelium fungivorum TaxID=1890364 RepID=A0A2P6MQR8_9EUKA|nr:hypothetical protein PROFUN_16373 [Planoprotostelium fungivorum]